MNINAAAVAELLIDLEGELRNLGLWQSTRPSDAALASVQPFCVDTLDFHQWLQFVFIEKIRSILAHKALLPSACAIAPMGEEYYRGNSAVAGRLLPLLRAIDGAISNTR